MIRANSALPAPGTIIACRACIACLSVLDAVVILPCPCGHGHHTSQFADCQHFTLSFDPAYSPHRERRDLHVISKLPTCLPVTSRCRPRPCRMFIDAAAPPAARDTHVRRGAVRTPLILAGHPPGPDMRSGVSA